MATTKALLETAMKKVGSHAITPTTSSIDILSSTNYTSNATINYTAPCDGWLYARYGASTGNGYIGISSGFAAGSTDDGLTTQANSSSDSARTCLYLGKGNTGTVSLITRGGTLMYCAIAFIKSIGGGGLRLLRKLLSVEVQYGYA